MNTHFLSNFSPFYANKFGASPFNQKQQAEVNVSSSLNTPAKWTLLKQKSINDCSFRSPDRRMNSKSPFMTRLQLKLSRETSTEALEESVAPFRLQGETEKEGFNSGRLLNFGFSARDSSSVKHPQLCLKDVFDQSAFKFSPPIASAKKQAQKSNPLFEDSVYPRGAATSPRIRPFSPSLYTQKSFKDQSTTAFSEITSEETSLISPLHLKPQAFKKESSFGLNLMSVYRKPNEAFLVSETPAKTHQNFQYKSPAHKNIFHNFQPHPSFYYLEETQIADQEISFKQHSPLPLLKLAKLRSPSKLDQLSQIIGRKPNKRVQKSNTKKVTLFEKLTTKVSKPSVPKVLKVQELALVLKDKADAKAEKKKQCTCAKSKCLKLYCECFANGGVCGPDCGCVGCFNTDDNKELIQQAQEDIVKRDPNAFVNKILKSNGGKSLQHRKGCTCKKSGCQKGYCECFQMGVICSEACKCSGCANCEVNAKHHDEIEKPLAKRLRK